jgi:gliding motility-associated lipoprotein GldH
MKKGVFFTCILFVVLGSCMLKKKEVIEYHRFEKNSWYRYDKIVFNIPVEEINKPYDIILFARHSRLYEFDNLDFGLIMNTPSGEERINQYKFILKDKFGRFIGIYSQDTCEAEIAIKKGIFFSQKGWLKIEIENLVPRLEVKELFGVGIKLVPGN